MNFTFDYMTFTFDHMNFTFDYMTFTFDHMNFTFDHMNFKTWISRAILEHVMNEELLYLSPMVTLD